MRSRQFETGLILLALTAVLCSGAMAQSGNCTSALVSLAPCLSYITGNTSIPSPTCCSQLSTVARSSPLCLCAVMNGPAPSIGLPINQTLALQLPSTCRVQTPPVSQCNAAPNGPTASATSPVAPPVGSPAPMDDTPGSAITPSASESPSGGGSKTVPSTDAGSSDGNIARTPLNFVLFAVFATSCASIITQF